MCSERSLTSQTDTVRMCCTQDLHRLWDEYSQLHGDLEVHKSEAKSGADKRRAQLKRKINQLEQVRQRQQ